LDERIKAQLDAQREQLKALPPALSPAQLAALRLTGRGWRPSSPEAQQAREAIAAWRQDIADREKDLASRQEGLRELEAYAEREYGIPAPRPTAVNPPTTEHLAVDLPPAATSPVSVNDNHGEAAAEENAASPPRRKPGPSPTNDWTMVAAREMVRVAFAGEKVPSAPRMCKRVEDACKYRPGLTAMQRLIKLLLTPLPKS
jgi:hypothetical protein